MAGEMMFGLNQHHRCKRRAEEEDEKEAEADQPITKRLARLRIGRPPHHHHHHHHHHHLQPNASSPEPARDDRSTAEDDDRMYVDDTKDKVYIRDLESEIAQIEAEEPKGMFLPDIDRKISAIPQRLLQNQTNGANSQMVLYHVPSSISVPEEQDHVRKAIVASRARARERQVQENGEGQAEDARGVDSGQNMNGFTPAQQEGEEEEEDDDPDAMDLG